MDRKTIQNGSSQRSGNVIAFPGGRQSSQRNVPLDQNSLKQKRFILGGMDFPLFIAITVLSVFGLIMVLSASYYNNIAHDKDALETFMSQAFWYVLGFSAMIIIANLKNIYQICRWGSLLAYVASILLLILVLFVGQTKNGSQRWLGIGGASFQPSELAKFALIGFLSAFMASKQKAMSKFKYGFWRCFVPIIIFICIICVLIFLQPNKSTAMIIGATAIALMISAGENWGHITMFFIAAAVGVGIILISDEYSLSRILNIDPFLDPMGDGYQLKQSMFAIASGGWFGTGLGMSKQKLLFLTYAESDYIFAIICEEWGFLGALALIGLYLFIFWRGVKIALTCRSRFGSLFAFGISIVFIIQAFINIAVATGLIPSTGQPLPLISDGGTSLLFYMVAFGLLLNISKDTIVAEPK